MSLTKHLKHAPTLPIPSLFIPIPCFYFFRTHTIWNSLASLFVVLAPSLFPILWSLYDQNLVCFGYLSILCLLHQVHNSLQTRICWIKTNSISELMSNVGPLVMIKSWSKGNLRTRKKCIAPRKKIFRIWESILNQFSEPYTLLPTPSPPPPNVTVWLSYKNPIGKTWWKEEVTAKLGEQSQPYQSSSLSQERWSKQWMTSNQGGTKTTVRTVTCMYEFPKSDPSQRHCLLPRPCQPRITLPKDTSDQIASDFLGLAMAQIK